MRIGVIFLILATAAATITTNPHEANARGDKPLHLNTVPPPQSAEFDKTSLYAVELSCKKNQEVFPYSEQKKVFLEKTTYTTALSILISKTPPTMKADGTASLAASAVAFVPIVIVDKDAPALDNSDACSQSFLVYNAGQLFLVPTVSLSTTHQAGFFVNVADKVMDVATSVAPVILGSGISATLTGNLSNVQKTVAPINALLKTFDETRNYTATEKLLMGPTVVSTDYTTITINVRAVKSVVDDKNKDFADALKKEINTALSNSKLSPTDPDPNCLPIANALNNAGFHSDRDQAFALGYIALSTFKTKDQIMSCLGTDYVVEAAQLGDLLWAGVPHSLVVTLDDASNYVPSLPSAPVQPPFEKKLQGTLYDLMDALGTYARRPDLSQPAVVKATATLTESFATNVTIVDRAGGIFAESAQTFTVPAIVDFLISKGFRRYGCYAQTTEETGKLVTGASAIFLAFRADPLATTTKVSDGIAINPIYQKGKIATLSIADNRSGWIDYVLSHRDKAYYCSNLEVQK